MAERRGHQRALLLIGSMLSRGHQRALLLIGSMLSRGHQRAQLLIASMPSRGHQRALLLTGSMAGHLVGDAKPPDELRDTTTIFMCEMFYLYNV